MSDDLVFSMEGARDAARRDVLGEWVAEFLSSAGSDNEDLAEDIVDDGVVWHGPIRLPFDQLHRLAGPPDQPTMDRMDDDDLEVVEGMEESLDEGWEPPPLVVTWKPPQLVLEDGNHRVESLRREGHADYWSVVRFSSAQERDRFLGERPDLR